MNRTKQQWEDLNINYLGVGINEAIEDILELYKENELMDKIIRERMNKYFKNKIGNSFEGRIIPNE